MGKIVTGVVCALLAAGWFLYGLGCESNARDPWLLAKIPALWFFGIEIPRVFALGLAVVWFGGGMKMIADGFGDVVSVRAFATKLQAGMDAAQLLQEDVQGTSWSNEMCERAAQDIIRGRPYAPSIKAIRQRTGKTLDEVVLSYKLAVDFLADRCAHIRQAVLKVGASCAVPDFSFPAVRVTESQKRTLADRFTKVDLSSTGDVTPLLTQGDLIYSYDGKLLWKAEQLGQLAGASGERDRVRVAVLRRVKTTNNHPIMGVANEYAWQALQFDIAGGPIGAGYETQGSQPQDPPPTPSVVPEDAGAHVIRFTCPGCAKRLKCAAKIAGKTIRCPQCQLSVSVPEDSA